MVGAVVLGIFAMVYTQQMQNRANVSLIGDLMSFREQVITYYGSVVSNRSTWECTIQSNGQLQQYLAGCTVPPCPTPLPAGINYLDGTLDIYDYTGNCQERFGGAGGILRIPSGNGLGLKLQDHNDLPIDGAANPCDPDIHHFCLKVEWEGLDPDQSSQRAVELKLILTANRKAIKDDLDVSFELADKEYAIYMNRTVATDCSDGRVTGYFPGTAKGRARPWHSSVGSGHAAPHTTSKGVSGYAGDTAVVEFDSITGLVACSPLGPLVVPPCYDMSDYSYIDDYPSLRPTYVNPFISRNGMPGYRGFQSGRDFGNITIPPNARLQCDGSGACCSGSAGATCPCSTRPGQARIAVKGRCPETAGSGTTAIAYFDPQTGISHCSNPNILVEKVDQTLHARHCPEDNKNQFGIIKIRAQDDSGGAVGTFRCSTDRWGTNKGGVEPGKGTCNPGQAISTIGPTGQIIQYCADGGTLQSDRPRGFPGPRGLRGKPGRCYGLGEPGRDAIQTCPGGCFRCSPIPLPNRLPCRR